MKKENVNRSELVTKTRKDYKEKGALKFWWEQLKSEYVPTKEDPYRPYKSIFIFFFYVIVAYSFFVCIQALLFGMTYCESTVGIEGPYVPSRVEWVTYNEQRTITCSPTSGLYDAMNNPYNPAGMDVNCGEAPVLSCDFDLNRTRNEGFSTYASNVLEAIQYKVPLWN